MFGRNKNNQQPTRKLKKQPRLQRSDSRSLIRAPQLVVPKQTQEAAQRRRRDRQKQKWAWPTAVGWQILTSTRWVSLAVLTLAIYGLLFVGSSSNFYVTRIPVEGVYAIPAEEIVQASGLGGQHIFAVNPAQVAASVAKTAGVTAVQIELYWPNQAHIRITEDVPVAVWEQNGYKVWVNATGELLPARLELPGLLHIRSEAPHGIIGWQEEAVADGQIPQGYVPSTILMGALQLRELFPNQTNFVYHEEHGLILEDGRGWRVYLGTGHDMPQKLVVHEAIVQELAAQGLRPEYVSVSNQAKPYYRASGQ